MTRVAPVDVAVVTHIYPANPNSPSDIAGNFIPPFARELADHGANLNILAPQIADADCPDLRLPVTRFSWWRDARPLGQFRVSNPLDAARLLTLIWSGIRGLNALVARENVDAVLACWAIPAGFIASYAKKPYAIWALGSDIHTYTNNAITRPFVLRALRNADLRYANSLTLARQVEKITGMNCALLHNMRPLPANVPRADFPNDRFNFLAAARLENVKGIDILLDALAQLAPPRPRVYIAGSGSLERKLRQQAARLDLQDDVVFMGLLDERGMASALSVCDALVIPSRDESIPMIFKEGAQFGVPVVAADVGDLGAFIRDYSAGIVVPANDASALARGMREMMNSPREKYRARLADLASQFDLARSADQMLRDIAAVIGR
jgi:glycosyltransferase involved in cell wall biosynthesis